MQHGDECPTLHALYIGAMFSNSGPTQRASDFFIE